MSEQLSSSLQISTETQVPNKKERYSSAILAAKNTNSIEISTTEAHWQPDFVSPNIC